MLPLLFNESHGKLNSQAKTFNLSFPFSQDFVYHGLDWLAMMTNLRAPPLILSLGLGIDGPLRLFIIHFEVDTQQFCYSRQVIFFKARENFPQLVNYLFCLLIHTLEVQNQPLLLAYHLAMLTWHHEERRMTLVVLIRWVLFLLSPCKLQEQAFL